jgi:hypothetical protein
MSSHPIPAPLHAPQPLRAREERPFLSDDEYSQRLDVIARCSDPQEKESLTILLFLKQWRGWEPDPISILPDAFRRRGWRGFDPFLWGFSEDTFAARQEQIRRHIQQREALLASRSRLLSLLRKYLQQRFLRQRADALEDELF